MSASRSTEAEDKPLSPQTDGQFECFKWHTPEHAGDINPEQKKDWESHVPALVHNFVYMYISFPIICDCDYES